MSNGGRSNAEKKITREQKSKKAKQNHRRNRTEKIEKKRAGKRLADGS